MGRRHRAPQARKASEKLGTTIQPTVARSSWGLLASKKVTARQHTPPPLHKHAWRVSHSTLRTCMREYLTAHSRRTRTEMRAHSVLLLPCNTAAAPQLRLSTPPHHHHHHHFPGHVGKASPTPPTHETPPSLTHSQAMWKTYHQRVQLR